MERFGGVSLSTVASGLVKGDPCAFVFNLECLAFSPYSMHARRPVRLVLSVDQKPLYKNVGLHQLFERYIEYIAISGYL